MNGNELNNLYSGLFRCIEKYESELFVESNVVFGAFKKTNELSLSKIKYGSSYLEDDDKFVKVVGNVPFRRYNR